MTTALLLVAVAGARAAQRLLRRGGVRVRARAPGAARGATRRRAGAAPRWRSRSPTTSRATCRRASSGSRSPRWASASSASRRSRRSSRTSSATSISHGVVARDLARARVPDLDLAAHHDRRAGPEDLLDPEVGARRALRRPAAVPVHARRSTRSSSLLNGASNAILRLIGVRTSGNLEEGETPEELKVLIQQSLDRRQARPRRGGDAHRRLPPARAGGAPGDDARRRRS